MISWAVWAIFAFVTALLGFAGYHFSVRSLRYVALITAIVLAGLITWYGLAHTAPVPANLQNSFTQGADAVSSALFHPLRLGHKTPAPGRVGWIVITVGLVFGYRGLEVWAMRWQAPVLDVSKLGEGQPSIKPDTTGGRGRKANGGLTDAQRHEQLVAELRFRLAAVEVRAPAILPGGSRSNALASIAEASGVTGSGVAGAVIRFFGMLWPTPRRYRLQVWVEPDSRQLIRVTIDLEDPRSGSTVATKTIAAADLDEAASMVAGYVARHVFVADRGAPPWCVGAADGSDLGAMLLAHQHRVHLNTARDMKRSRREQIKALEKATVDNVRCSGFVNYELAQLYDLGRDHVAALRLHAVNREQYPRFYRGRYRLGMSLEMIANRGFTFGTEDKAAVQQSLEEILDMLNRCGVTHDVHCTVNDFVTLDDCPGVCRLRDTLSMKLLDAARTEFATIRKQLTLRHVIWATFIHRDERTARKPFWRRRERQSFRDGVCVAELLVAVRQRLNVDERSLADDRKSYRNSLAMCIATAIAGDTSPVRSVIDHPHDQWQREYPPVDPALGAITDQLRWRPGQRRTASWQAAYNMACLYAALAVEGFPLEDRVVISLQRAVNNHGSEMERPSDWISHDPDFQPLQSAPAEFPGFAKFLSAQQRKDYPVSGEMSVATRPVQPV
jgi:hypothetical protein